jgi:hypothetical protein
MRLSVDVGNARSSTHGLPYSEADEIDVASAADANLIAIETQISRGLLERVKTELPRQSMEWAAFGTAS